MNILLRGYAMSIMGMVCFVLTASAWAVGPSSSFTNTGSIANTRHNLSHSTIGVGIVSQHNPYRNNYVEVCVYCHTPHGANQTSTAPLWNRTIKDTTYNTYNQAGTSSLTQTVRQPGGSSLTCLSCHDGQTAIDSIINMPGTFRNQTDQATQSTIQSTTFLNTWDNPPAGPAANTTSHRGINSTNGVLGNGTGSDGVGCMACHSPVGVVTVLLDAGEIANDMRLFNIGTDLRNDHPVGVTYPAVNGPEIGWKIPGGVKGSARYFDTPGGIAGQMDKGDIRIYGAGQGGADGAPSATVECASCHDPHGVPDQANGGKFYPTFLRASNAGSAVCLTCHTK